MVNLGYIMKQEEKGEDKDGEQNFFQVEQRGREGVGGKER